MAKSRSIGSIYAELSLRDKMGMGLKKAERNLVKWGKSSLKYGAVAGAGLTAGVSAGMIAGTKRALDLGGRLSDVSTQTGIAVADVMKLERAFSEGGLSVDAMGKNVARMQKTIFDTATGRSTEDPFAALNLSAKELMAMRPADQFQAIGDAIKAIEDPTLRNAAAMQIFGKSGTKLMTVFGQIDGTARSLGRMPQVAEKFADSFDRASDIIGELPAKSDQFFVGFTSGIIGNILPALEEINGKDFTTLGESLGFAVSTALEAITDGSMWEIFKIQGQMALESLRGSTFNTGLAADINSIWDTITGQSSNYQETFDKYYQAGMKVRDENLGALQKKLDDIMMENAVKAVERRSEYEKRQSDKPKPTEEIPDVFKKKEIVREVRSTTYEVNDLQRRGLGYGAEDTSKQANKSVDLLKEIRDLMKKEREPQPAMF